MPNHRCKDPEELADEIVEARCVDLDANCVGKAKDDRGWEHFAWKLTLRCDGRTIEQDYKCGLAHVEWTERAPEDARKCSPTASPFGRETVWLREMREKYTRPKAPEAADVLYALASDFRLAQEATLDEFAEELEITKPTEAIRLYTECQAAGAKLRHLLGADADRLL